MIGTLGSVFVPTCVDFVTICDVSSAFGQRGVTKKQKNDIVSGTPLKCIVNHPKWKVSNKMEVNVEWVKNREG